MSSDENEKGLRVLPGKWRPHYSFEQIAWLKPSWPSEDYVWLDFPEAIFTDRGLHYLSHLSSRFPALNENLSEAPWKTDGNGISFERTLPDGIHFGGSVTKRSDAVADLMLYVRNGSETPLTGIKLQTCAYLRAVRELAEYTNGNKLVHLPKEGWVSYFDAEKNTGETGCYRLGWRGGPKAADLPVILTQSLLPDHYAAMTWFESTYSLVGNPHHPCMHADPFFPDIPPGDEHVIRGAFIFFEGALKDFADYFL